MMADAYTQAETLQKLERLTQLETMVAEQRIRIEKYRTMYETIKTEHVQLEEVSQLESNLEIKSKLYLRLYIYILTKYIFCKICINQDLH